MKTIIFAALLAVAAARPDRVSYDNSGSNEFAHTIRDDRQHPGEGGAFSYDVETSNGIVLSKSGYGSGPDGAVESQGSVQFEHPNGELFELKFVADAGGYKPESSALPIAPAFPHEIPQFVLDQIAKAAEEDAGRSSASIEAGRYD